ADDAEARALRSGGPAHADVLHRVAADLDHPHVHFDHPLAPDAADQVDDLRIATGDFGDPGGLLFGNAVAVDNDLVADDPRLDTDRAEHRADLVEQPARIARDDGDRHLALAAVLRPQVEHALAGRFG